MNEIKKIVMFLGLLALAGCGAGEGSGNTSGIALKVMNVGGFDTGVEHGRIEKYRVTVTGEDISPAIVVEFDGDASEGIIEDIPSGKEREVSVEAVNPNGLSIHAGEAAGVKVGGGVTEVEIALEAVPIFTNVADGNTVDNTRLVFKVFSNPTNPVLIEEIGSGTGELLVDASTAVPELYLDQSTGMGRLAPALMEPGVRTFSVRDAVTGRSSELSVRLLDGTGRRAAPIVSAASHGRELNGCSAFICAP